MRKTSLEPQQKCSTQKSTPKTRQGCFMQKTVRKVLKIKKTDKFTDIGKISRFEKWSDCGKMKKSKTYES